MTELLQTQWEPPERLFSYEFQSDWFHLLMLNLCPWFSLFWGITTCSTGTLAHVGMTGANLKALICVQKGDTGHSKHEEAG
jgi:hypothetical protein